MMYSMVLPEVHVRAGKKRGSRACNSAASLDNGELREEARRTVEEDPEEDR